MTKWLQFIIISFIIILFITACCLLSQRLSYQFLYYRASNQISKQQYSLAAHTLEKATRIHSNDYQSWNKLGDSYLKIGSSKPLKEVFEYAKKSKKAYRNATKFNPLDAEAFYGLARAEARLERLYPLIYNGTNPYNAILYFDEAIRLRPNSITYKYRLIQHLHFTGRQDKLLSTISDLAKIYPSIYNQLKEEPFWSPEARTAVKKGVQEAIKERINLKIAYPTITFLLSEEEDWENALYYYQQYLDLNSNNIDSEQVLYLSTLFLKTEQLKNAEQRFLKALTLSTNKINMLGRILKAYAQTNDTKALLHFYETATKNFLLPAESNSLLAKMLIDLGQYDQANTFLINLNKRKASAQNYYWLARVAEKQKDWSTMERTAQKATLMDVNNSDYHLLFSQILTRQKKLKEAEEELDLAIKYTKKSSYLLFYHRAIIRSRNYNFKGSAEDWESVISLRPIARYYGHAAEAYERLGKKSIALEYYSKAASLDSKNKYYQKRYQELKDRD